MDEIYAIYLIPDMSAKVPGGEVAQGPAHGIAAQAQAMHGGHMIMAGKPMEFRRLSVSGIDRRRQVEALVGNLRGI